MNAYDSNELHELLDALVDQRITEEQHARLKEVLKSSSLARRYYLDFIDLHFDLRRLERLEAECDPIVDLKGESFAVSEGMPSAMAGVPASATSETGTITPRPARKMAGRNYVSEETKWSAFAWAALVTAASLLIAISVLLWQVVDSPPLVPFANRNVDSNSNKPKPEAILTQAIRATFFGELMPSLQSRMESNHEYALTTGMIEVQFPTGASVIIEAPAVFSIASDTRLLMHTGQCSVHAPDGAEGFRVETPLAKIVDLGTRFSVSVDEAGGTDVQVVEGIAEVFARNGSDQLDTQPVRLTERQALGYSDSGGIISQVREYDNTRYRSQLPDRVVSYQAHEPNGHGAVDLLELTVQRGGKVYAYAIDDLIGIKLTHFKSAAGKNANPVAYGLNADDTTVDQIVADNALNTGIINPGGAIEPIISNPVMASPESENTPNTPGMAIRFLKPVINDVGPDVVLFDLQTFTNPPGGDAFHVGPVSFEPGLRSYTIRSFDITLNSREAKVLESFGLMRADRSVNSVEDLKSIKLMPSRVHTLFRSLAVGIDLSDLGYEPGASVDRLFIQDALDDPDSFVDPALIVGLPSVGE